MLTRKDEYALRAICALVSNYSGQPRPIDEIAEPSRAAQKFMEPSLLELRLPRSGQPYDINCHAPDADATFEILDDMYRSKFFIGQLS